MNSRSMLFVFCLFLGLYNTFASADKLPASSTEAQQYETTTEQSAKRKCGCEAPSETIQKQFKCKLGSVKVKSSTCRTSSGNCVGACSYECKDQSDREGFYNKFNLSCIWGTTPTKNDVVVPMGME
jgi:hypothetical protein